MEPVRLGPLTIGDHFLDKYEVRRVIGSGGHAFVYECFDMFLSRVVAIKVIKSSLDSAANIHARARTEAQLLVRIDHPNLVKVIDAGAWQGLVYIVMEYLDGRNLREVLREVGRLSVAEALAIGCEVAGGMAYAHGKQVIHRDLKPENIFILAHNAAKVLDFGIAKVRGLDGLDPKTTQPDMVQGTWLYMSPEHLQGHPVTERSDIFALGTMLFESLYMHPLRVGEEPVGRDQAAWMQMFKVPPLLSDLDPSIPRYVAKVIHRALLKVPGERYANMAEVRDAFLGALKRHLQEDAPSGLVVTRSLYRPLPAEPLPTQPEASRRNTLRADPVLTNQVTVKAPHVQSGQTEPLVPLSPKLLRPEGREPSPKVRSDQPAQPRRITPPRSISRPPSSDKPTIWVQSSATTASRPLAAPGPTARPGAGSITPSTAPPVTTRAPLPPVPVASWLEDRTLKLAAIAAVLSGVVGGTAYGLLATRPDRATASSVESARSASSATAEPTPESPSHRDVTPTTPAAPEAAQPKALEPTPAQVALPPAVSARPAALTTAPAPRTQASTVAKRAAPGPEVTVDSGLPTLDEVQRRFDEHDRKTNTKPTPVPVKPKATPSPPRQTLF